MNRKTIMCGNSGGLRQRYCGKTTSIIIFSAMAGSTITEKQVFRAVGIHIQRIPGRDARVLQASQDESLQIEEVFVGITVGPEKNHGPGVVLDERKGKIGPDLVGALGNAGADRCPDIAPPGAKVFHGGNGVFDNAAQCTAPSRMRGAYDPGFWICKKDRGAIGGQDAEGDARGSCYHCICLRAFCQNRRRIRQGHNLGAMDLVKRDQSVFFKFETGCGPAFVFDDSVRRV